jgi:hypothetical protein
MASRLLALAVLALLMAGCASPGERRARALVAEAESAFARGDFETSYARAAEVRRAHPASAERDRAFALACGSWKPLYHRSRYVDPDARWVATEPAFLFDWLASYFGEASPEEPARVLFVGTPRGVLRDFEAFAHARPELSRWRLVARDDNGVIREVTAEPADADAAAP